MDSELWAWVKLGSLTLLILGLGFSFFEFGIWLLKLVVGL